MADLVIGERRREPRRSPSAHEAAIEPQVPGARVLEVLDVSRHGLRCRLAHPVRPGRTMGLRVQRGGTRPPLQAAVVRCTVVRVSRHGLQYEAAWSFDRAWLGE